MIETIQISTNRYAPPGAQAINMYSVDGGEKLTLGQLLAAVCVRAAANMEAQSINKMNAMNSNVQLLETASEYMMQIASGSVSDWPTVRDFLRNSLGMTTTTAPDTLDTSYNGRMKLVKAMKEQMEAMTKQAQEDMIEVQSLVNQRDVCFTTGTSLVRSTGTSANNIAMVL